MCGISIPKEYEPFISAMLASGKHHRLFTEVVFNPNRTLEDSVVERLGVSREEARTMIQEQVNHARPAK